MKKEDDSYFNDCLSKLGLCERKGLDGAVMLYPILPKERKLERDEFQSMLKRLYQVKSSENEFGNVNFFEKYCE